MLANLASLMGTMKNRSSDQASSNTETQPGRVVKLYTDALGNVTHADVRLFGIPRPLERIENGSNIRLYKGAEVTVNWSRGSRLAPTILGVSGAQSGGVIAEEAQATSDAALSSDSDSAADLTGLGFLIPAPDPNIPDGVVEVQGANVTFEDAAPDGTTNATRTVHAKPGVYAALPAGPFLDGTVADLMDASGNPLGMYRYEATAGIWRRRDAGGGATFGPQPANTVFRGPTSGADALPVFGLLVTNDLPDLGVTSGKLDNAAVTNPKLGTAAVSTAKIADKAVTGAKLEDILTAGTFIGANYSFTFDTTGRCTGIIPYSGGGTGTFYWGSSARTSTDATLHDNYRPDDGPHIQALERTTWAARAIEVFNARVRDVSSGLGANEFGSLKDHLTAIWQLIVGRTLSPAGQAAGKVAVTNGSNGLVWQALGTGATGAASGDLSGTYPGPTVAKVQGKAWSTTAPSVGQIPKWNGTEWAPAADIGSGNVTIRQIVGTTSDLVQTDDAVLLNASVLSTTLKLRGTMAGNKCFDIRRTDTNSSNTCYLELATSEGGEFPDGTGDPPRYAIPPHGGVRLMAYKADGANIVYMIIAIYPGTSGGMTSLPTEPVTP